MGGNQETTGGDGHIRRRMSDGGPTDLFRTLIDNLHDGVYFVDTKRRIQYWSRGAERITGYTAKEVVGRCCGDNILEHVNDDGVHLCLGMCPLQHSMLDGRPRQARVYLKHKNGHRLPVNVFAAPLHDDHGVVVGAVESFRDDASLPESLQEVEQLKKLIYLCPVTGIPNRRYADDVLLEKFYQMLRTNRHVGVAFVDIDNFKAINDAHGHATGDLVLKMVAQTLANAMRSYDLLARWGGEEFIAILPLQTPEQFAPALERLRMLVQSASRGASEERLTVTVSIGGVAAGYLAKLPEILERADRLMYQSKHEGRNRVTLEIE